jgi:hypothetical protein
MSNLSNTTIENKEFTPGNPPAMHGRFWETSVPLPLGEGRVRVSRFGKPFQSGEQ